MVRPSLSVEASPNWARIAERLSFLFPLAIGVGAIGLLAEYDPGVPGLGLALVLVGSFGYAILTLALVLVLWLDARRIRSRFEPNGDSRLKDQWKPRPVLVAIGALILAPAAAVGYLYRRHKRYGTPAGWSGWWSIVAFSLVVSVFGLTLAIVGFVLAVPGLAATALGVAGTVAVGAFPAAIHQDAAYVSHASDFWQPNPAGYLGLAFLSLFVPLLQPALAAYYLVRRRRALRERVR